MLVSCWIPSSINGLMMSLAHLMIVGSCLVDFHVFLILNIRLLYISYMMCILEQGDIITI